MRTVIRVSIAGSQHVDAACCNNCMGNLHGRLVLLVYIGVEHLH